MSRIPKLSRLLAIPAALVAVVAFSSSASAYTGEPTQIDVGANTAAGTHAISGVNKGTITASLGGLNATCTGATPVGTVDSGPHTVGNKFMNISAFNIAGCTGIFGVGVTLTNNCDGLVKTINPTSVVTNAITDNVAVKLDLGAGCLHVQTAAPFSSCTMDIAGQVDATFKETNKSGTQELSISGSTLYATNVGDCFGIVEDNDTVSFALNVNFTSADGLINLKP